MADDDDRTPRRRPRPTNDQSLPARLEERVDALDRRADNASKERDRLTNQLVELRERCITSDGVTQQMIRDLTALTHSVLDVQRDQETLNTVTREIQSYQRQFAEEALTRDELAFFRYRKREFDAAAKSNTEVGVWRRIQRPSVVFATIGALLNTIGVVWLYILPALLGHHP